MVLKPKRRMGISFATTFRFDNKKYDKGKVKRKKKKANCQLSQSNEQT